MQTCGAGQGTPCRSPESDQESGSKLSCSWGRIFNKTGKTIQWGRKLHIFQETVLGGQHIHMNKEIRQCANLTQGGPTNCGLKRHQSKKIKK